MYIFILILFISGNVFANVVFQDCGSSYALHAVEINGCGMSLPCYVTLGDHIPVKLLFKATYEAGKMDQDVVITINQINQRTDVTPELCDRVQCPVRTDGLTDFHSVMSVPPTMGLNQRGYLRWRIYDESGRTLLCYSVLVQTQNLVQKVLRSRNYALTEELPLFNSLPYPNDHNGTVLAE